MARLILASVVGGSIFSGLVQLVGETFAFFGTAAAGIAGAVYIYRKVVKPGAEVMREVHEAVPALRRLPEWMDSVDERLDRGQQRMGKIESGLQGDRELEVAVHAGEERATVVELRQRTAPERSVSARTRVGD